MALYRYQCLNARGKNVAGTVEGETTRAAMSILQSRGLFPTEPLHELRGGSDERTATVFRRRAARGDLALLADQLRLLLAAGLPMSEALDTLAAGMEHPDLKAALLAARQAVMEGESLSTALSREPGLFPRDFVQMIAAGESSGHLAASLGELAGSLGQQAQTISRIGAAMTYPLLMAGVGGLILIFLVTAVVPKVAGVFAEAHQALPWPTRFLLAASSMLSDYGLAVLAGCILAAGAVWRLAAAPWGRVRMERRLLGIPWLGRVASEVMTIRLSRTLAGLLRGGVPLAPALPLAGQTLTMRVYQTAIDEAARAVTEGRNLSAALAETGLFPAVMLRLTEVGERTGNLPEVFVRAAELYEGRLTLTLARWSALAEPVMILVMGAAVGFITLAILLPIFEMSSLGM